LDFMTSCTQSSFAFSVLSSVTAIIVYYLLVIDPQLATIVRIRIKGIFTWIGNPNITLEYKTKIIEVLGKVLVDNVNIKTARMSLIVNFNLAKLIHRVPRSIFIKLEIYSTELDGDRDLIAST